MTGLSGRNWLGVGGGQIVILVWELAWRRPVNVLVIHLMLQQQSYSWWMIFCWQELGFIETTVENIGRYLPYPSGFCGILMNKGILPRCMTIHLLGNRICGKMKWQDRLENSKIMMSFAQDTVTTSSNISSLFPYTMCVGLTFAHDFFHEIHQCSAQTH